MKHFFLLSTLLSIFKVGAETGSYGKQKTVYITDNTECASLTIYINNVKFVRFQVLTAESKKFSLLGCSAA
jgi:hypothetical protein